MVCFGWRFRGLDLTSSALGSSSSMLDDRCILPAAGFGPEVGILGAFLVREVAGDIDQHDEGRGLGAVHKPGPHQANEGRGRNAHELCELDGFHQFFVDKINRPVGAIARRLPARQSSNLDTRPWEIGSKIC